MADPKEFKTSVLNIWIDGDDVAATNALKPLSDHANRFAQSPENSRQEPHVISRRRFDIADLAHSLN